MTDIILESNTNDITFEGDDLAFFSEGDDQLVAQRLEIKLRSLKGEWFRDINYGIPYLQEILATANNGDLADTYIKRTIQDDEDILSLTSYSSLLEVDQVWSVKFTAKLKSGGSATLELEV